MDHAPRFSPWHTRRTFHDVEGVLDEVYEELTEKVLAWEILGLHMSTTELSSRGSREGLSRCVLLPSRDSFRDLRLLRFRLPSYRSPWS